MCKIIFNNNNRCLIPLNLTRANKCIQCDYIYFIYTVLQADVNERNAIPADVIRRYVRYIRSRMLAFIRRQHILNNFHVTWQQRKPSVSFTFHQYSNHMWNNVLIIIKFQSKIIVMPLHVCTFWYQPCLY